MMTFSAERLARSLRELEGGRAPRRYLVAFSGGLDSTVLLHALSQAAVPVTAVHVDHDLHRESAAWADHCRRIAAGLKVACVTRKAAVTQDAIAELGVEAAAREARYAVLLEVVEGGDALLSAHHRDDQAETVLLNLMRGSGAAGVAGIGAARPFGAGMLLRPLLDVSRAELAHYGAQHGLDWLEDPANDDARFDRNFLRREILPRLHARWPAAAERLMRSAELASESAGLQDDLAALDLARLAGDDGAGRLEVAALEVLSPARQRNVLRYAVRCSGLPPVPSRRLQQAVAELVPARPDAQPLVRWRGGELRRHRGYVYVLPEISAPVDAGPMVLSPECDLSLGPGLGTLRLQADVAPGLDPALVAAGIEVRFRAGGERMRPLGSRNTRTLKKMLQEAGIVPWMRERLPLLYAGDVLVGVGDLWIAADAASDRGYGLRWLRRPPLL